MYWDEKHEIETLQLGAKSVRTKNVGTKSMGPKVLNQKVRVKSMRPKVRNQKFGTKVWDKSLVTKSVRTKSMGPKIRVAKKLGLKKGQRANKLGAKMFCKIPNSTSAVTKFVTILELL